MNWDLLDEDCTAIGDWVDGDIGDAVSSVDPAGQFKFDSGPTSAASNDYALRTRDIGSYPDIFTVEAKLYHDALGSRGDADHFQLRFDHADKEFPLYFGTGGLFTYDTDTGYIEIGTDLVKFNGSAEWQIWRFLVDLTGAAAVGVVDVYLKDSTHNWEKVGSAIQCSVGGSYTDGRTRVDILGFTNNNRITHMDYIKAATGLFLPVFPRSQAIIIG